MKAFFHSSPGAIFHHSYLGGIVLVLGVFLLTLAKPNLGQSTPLPYLAQFTLGVFVSHALVIYTLVPISNRLQHLFPVWQLLFSLGVYILAVLFTIVLSTIPVPRYLVTRTTRARSIPSQALKPTSHKISLPDSIDRMPEHTRSGPAHILGLWRSNTGHHTEVYHFVVPCRPQPFSSRLGRVRLNAGCMEPYSV